MAAVADSHPNSSATEAQKSCLQLVFSRQCRFYLMLLWIGAISVSLNLYTIEQFNTGATSTETTAAVGGTREHTPVIYGHVHMAKTGGSSLNWVLANNFRHVCGHKGYSYDAYQENERFKGQGGIIKRLDAESWSRSRVNPGIMSNIGYEECDYISHEMNWNFWLDTFPNGTFHGVPVELHVPCRNRIDHLMSQCNFDVVSKWNNRTKQKLACDATTDQELFQSVNNCFLHLRRFDHELLKYFDVKCFDFDKQFDGYVQYMSNVLSIRRFVSEPLAKRESNDSRNKTQECIWNNPVVLEKVDQYLINSVPYYQFCNSCMGSQHEIVLSVKL